MKMAESSSENGMVKGEIAWYEQFLLFPQSFQKTCTADTYKPGLVLERVKWRKESCNKTEKKKLLVNGILSFFHKIYYCFQNQFPFFSPVSHECVLPLLLPCCPLVQQWLCGKAASGLERILCRVPVKELQDRCTGCHNTTEILLKTALNTIQSINCYCL